MTSSNDIYALVGRVFDRDTPDAESLPEGAALIDRAATALRTVLKYGGIDGDHHKTWVLDQVVRALTGPAYEEFVRRACVGADGPDTYEWDTGIAP